MLKKLVLALSLLAMFGMSSAMAQAPTNCPTELSSCVYKHISTNATTSVKSGAGILHSITINTVGATDTVTIYDNTAGSGTVIAVLSSLTSTTLVFDVAFNTGLTIVSSGTTAPDLTVSYR